MTDRFRAHAPAYWDRGFSVVPIEPGTKRPAKEIMGWQGYCNGPPSTDVRQKWLARYADYGIGLLLNTEIAPGWRIAAVDVDDDRYVELARVVLGDCISGKRGKKGATFFVKVGDK